MSKTVKTKAAAAVVEDTPKEEQKDVKIFSENLGYSVVETGFISATTREGERRDADFDYALYNNVAKTLEFATSSNEMALGDSKVVEVNYTPTVASCPRLVWESSDESVAVVNDWINGNGRREENIAVVYAANPGTATISVVACDYPELTASFELTVTSPTEEDEKEPKEGAGSEDPGTESGGGVEGTTGDGESQGTSENPEEITEE